MTPIDTDGELGQAMMAAIREARTLCERTGNTPENEALRKAIDDMDQIVIRGIRKDLEALARSPVN
jgi:hypothetical protein